MNQISIILCVYILFIPSAYSHESKPTECSIPDAEFRLIICNDNNNYTFNLNGRPIGKVNSAIKFPNKIFHELMHKLQENLMSVEIYSPSRKKTTVRIIAPDKFPFFILSKIIYEIKYIGFNNIALTSESEIEIPEIEEIEPND